MGDTAFGGRSMGDAFEILLQMAKSPSCRVVLTVSGAMTVAKQGQIICDMIDRGLVHAVVATGALVAHGLTEAIGLVHYRHDASKSDEDLYARGYNRVYDTLEMEANLNEMEVFVSSVLNNETPAHGTWWSAELCRAIGKRLSREAAGPGILRSAYEQNVPVFIPAFTDSELGLDVANWAMVSQQRKLRREGKPVDPAELFHCTPAFNPFLDLQEYARFVGQAEELGIFTVGGGVPRNWAQQVGPYYDVAATRLGVELPTRRFKYAVRICPEPVHWGGLSGCTYSEGVAWGKFVPESRGGRFAEVYADATLVWPLLIRALFEQLDAR